MSCTRCGGTGKVLDPVIFIDVACECHMFEYVRIEAEQILAKHLQRQPEEPLRNRVKSAVDEFMEKCLPIVETRIAVCDERNNSNESVEKGEMHLGFYTQQELDCYREQAACFVCGRAQSLNYVKFGLRVGASGLYWVCKQCD